MNLTEILSRHSTDKNTVHSYASIYEELLTPIRDAAECVLEVGIASGGSLRAWRDFFTKATIIGFDNEPHCMIKGEDRIVTCCGNQLSCSDLTAYSRKHKIQYDVIIDDGKHSIESQVLTLFFLYPELKDGGLYVIEDIQEQRWLDHFDLLTNAVKLDLRPVKGRYDDMMVVIRKPLHGIHLASSLRAFEYLGSPATKPKEHKADNEFRSDTTQPKRALILAVLGDETWHSSWISNPTLRKSFDLAIIYYGDEPNKYKDQADWYAQRKGYKYQSTYEALHMIDTSIYDYVWLPDEDIEMSTEDVLKMFTICRMNQLAMAQPAVIGETSYPHLRKLGEHVRPTHFVEVMAPIFSMEALKRVEDTFKESVSGWGLDFVWPKLLSGEKIAVLDAVEMKHARPVGKGKLYGSLKTKGINPNDECNRLRAKYKA